MANGYGQVNPTDLDAIRNMFRGHEDRIRELERPTGTQRANSVSRMVQFGSSGVSATGFAISTTQTVVASGSIDVPEGFSSATVMCIAGVTGVNGSASSDYLLCRASINGTGGGGRSTGLVAPTQAAGATGSAIRTINNLNAGTITVATLVWSSSNSWGPNASNLANMDAIVMFRR